MHRSIASIATLILAAASVACGGSTPNAATGAGGASATSAASSTATASATASTAATSTAATSSAATGATSQLDQLLAALEANRDAELQAVSDGDGWPAPVEGGYLFVSDDLARDRIAGDFDGWQPQAMNHASNFAWLVVKVDAGAHYKFTDGAADWQADPWSRAYTYDDHGEMSLAHPASGAHLERYFAVAAQGLLPRTVRVWLPAAKATRALYLHDGQNLFAPDAPWGGWRLEETVPDDMMLVGIDNTAARFDEYTHVPDDIGSGLVGGKGDAYADFVDGTVRALIAKHYGEPAIIGTMGSSLGGLISLHIADRFPGKYRFAGSLSGTLGWGRMGPNVHNETMIERYQKHGHRKTALYVDSGGGANDCAITDGDPISDDDPTNADNFCENQQMHQVLLGLGYQDGVDVLYWHEPGAQHNEAAWAARVFRPFAFFEQLQ